MRRKKTIPLWKKILVGIIIVVFIVMTFGLFIGSDEKVDNQENLEENDENSKSEINQDKIELQKEKLQNVNSKIKELEPKKVSIEKLEKRILIGSRISIAIIILFINGYYFYQFNLEVFSLGSQLNINAAITMIYAFVSFTLYLSLIHI